MKALFFFLTLTLRKCLGWAPLEIFSHAQHASFSPFYSNFLSGRFNDTFVEHRRRKLQRFISRVATHPVLGQSSVFLHFLSASDKKVETEKSSHSGQAVVQNCIHRPVTLPTRRSHQHIRSHSQEWKTGKRAAESEATSAFLAQIVTPSERTSDTCVKFQSARYRILFLHLPFFHSLSITNIHIYSLSFSHSHIFTFFLFLSFFLSHIYIYICKYILSHTHSLTLTLSLFTETPS